MLLPFLTSAQKNLPDSLRHVLQNAPDDSVRYVLNQQLLRYYYEVNRDSALYFAEQALLLSRKNNKKLSEAKALTDKGYQLMHLGRFAESLQSLLLAFKIAEDPESEKSIWILSNDSTPARNRLYTLSSTHNMFALLMRSTQNTEQEIFHFKETKRIAEIISHSGRLQLANINLGRTYNELNKLDSALMFAKDAERISMQSGEKRYLSMAYSVIGDIYLKKGNKILAKQYYYEGVQSGREQINMNGLIRNYFSLTKYYLSESDKDSSIYYAKKTLETLSSLGSGAGTENNIGTAYENLYHSYILRNQFDSAFKYQGLALVAKDSIYKDRIKSLSEFQNLSFREQFRLQDLEKEKVVYQNKIRTYVFIAGLGVFLLIALILYRNNRQKQKANKVLETTLNNLKSTQSQLIQSEKMASLGELTAGIAHEIQNPLNFVNNFSEVNKELLVEMKDEIKKGNIDEVNALADDVIANEEKINHHGKRADAIVKGMLQHSRSSNGVKEPTDINALADEYLRLAYHGLRAKDKSFNATMKTDYDESIGNINIIPQDIGRVILNLITNAFYAAPLPPEGGFLDPDYKHSPTVWVSTKKVGDKILISVRDNGPGIPKKILDKIFQPFFTTKPTGQGTGLGLSLSYDIVKAHGGELKVETKEGEGTRFTIQLPII